MVGDRASAATREGQAQRRPATARQSSGPDGDRVRAQDRDSLGAAAPRNGLWQRHDLLAPAGRMAGRRGLGAAPPSVARTPPSRRPTRLVAGHAGRFKHPRPQKGAGTGPNPTDRGKSGTKRHLVVDGHGTPLTIATTAANVHEVTQAKRMVAAIPAVSGRRGRPCQRPRKLHADKAYQSAAFRQYLRQRGIQSRIARKGIESKDRLGRYRWVVVRTFAWLNQ